MTRNLEHIVNDQVHKWAHEQHLLARRGNVHERWPIITISREYCAQGTEVAHRLSERIGFTLWDKDLVRAIAEASGGDESVVATLDERRRRAIDEAVQEVLSGARYANVRYHRTLLRVVHAVAARGGSVIIGRGASFICDPRTQLAVRIVAPLEERVRRFAAQNEIRPLEARRIVAQVDRERKDFIRDHFHHDVTDPAFYDLVINAHAFHVEQAVDLIMMAYEKKVGKRPREAEASAVTSGGETAATRR